MVHNVFRVLILCLIHERFHHLTLENHNRPTFNLIESMKSLLSAMLLFLAIGPLALSADESFKVMSYNIRYASLGDGKDVWPNRVDTVAKVIDDHDLVGLQEVTFPQLQDLQSRLKDFDTYSVGRNDGKTSGEHTTILFRRSRFEAIDQATFWLSENPQEVGSKGWDAAITRICSWVVLRDKKTDQRLWFANAHFDHQGSMARLESGKLIRTMMEAKSGALPVIVLGDFNCQAGSPPYQAMIADSEKPLVDARSISKTPPAGPNSTWSGFKKIATDRIIDHIFVAGNLQIDSLTVLDPKTEQGRFASDHLPVQVVAVIKD